jgi:hypothetical protein
MPSSDMTLILAPKFFPRQARNGFKSAHYTKSGSGLKSNQSQKEFYFVHRIDPATNWAPKSMLWCDLKTILTWKR